MSLYKTFNTLGQLPSDQVRDPNKQSRVIKCTDLKQKANVCSQNLITVINVSADWCGPCKQIAPRYENMADKYTKPGRCAFMKENVDNNIAMHGEHPPIRGVPTFLFYVNGQVQPDLTVVGADIDRVEKTLQDLLTN